MNASWRNGSAQRAALSVTFGLTFLTGCGTGTNGPSKSKQQEVVASNTACAIGEACELTALYPSGIPSGQMAIVGAELVRVGSQTELRGTEGDFAFAASSSGHVEVQSGAKVGGIWTQGSAFVGSQALVDGAVITGQTPEIQHGASTGPLETAVGSPAAATFTVTFPAGTDNDRTLQNQVTEDVPPGRYGRLHVHAGSTAHLETGVYYFEEVLVEPGGELLFDTSQGTAVVWVRGQLTSRGTWTSTASQADILVGTFSQGWVDIGQEFDATLLAPHATLVIPSANDASRAHNGLFFARHIELQGNARVEAVDITKSGPAYASLQGTWTPAEGVPAPEPPVADGLTLEEYREQLGQFLTDLLESGYRGPTVEVPPHPAATQGPSADDFALPTDKAAEQGVEVSITPAAPVESRPVIPLGVPLPDPDNPPHLEPTFDKLRDEVDDAQEDVYEALPFTAPGTPETGEGATNPPDFPTQCPLSGASNPTDATVGSLEEQFSGFNEGFEYGSAPSWINLDAYPGDSDRVIGSAVPDFDAYWFMSGYLASGYAAQRGLYGEVDGQLGFGGVVFSQPIRIADVRLHAESNTNDRRDGTPGPSYDVRLVAQVVGVTYYDFGREGDADISPRVFEQNLLQGKFALIPGGGIHFPIGPFAVKVNAGVEMSAPLAFNVDIAGPEVTFGPSARAFITVFGGIDLGIKVGLEGEADLLKVDAPFTAKLKWHNRLTPDTCAMSADLKATLEFEMTTLNGALYVVAGLSDSLIAGAQYREKILDFDGITLAHEVVNLLDIPLPDVLEYPQILCALGGPQCAEVSDADTTFDGFASSQLGSVQVDHADYGNSDCPGQYIVEIPVSGSGLDGVYVQGTWLSGDVSTEAECNDSHARIDTWVQGSGGWIPGVSAISLRGEWVEGDGCVQTISNATLPSGETQLYNNPWHYIALSDADSNVRLAVASEVTCTPKRLQVIASSARF